MEWQLVLLTLVSGLLFLLLLGVPVAFAFLSVNLLGMLIVFGGDDPLRQIGLSIYSSVTKFSLAPVPLFVLMGEVMFHSGVAQRMMDALDGWIGRVPGRLSLLAVGGGTIFATLSGSSIASTVMLGSVLVPEMRKRGYSAEMSVGPVLGSGTLASMIPPTALGVLLASLAEISVGYFLIAIIVPGLLMAALFAAYIIFRAYTKPTCAPRYQIAGRPLGMRIKDTLLYILPLSVIIFLVIGLILLGVATPNEAAALGALGCFVLAVIYQRGFNWGMVRRSVEGTVRVTGMLFLILAGATAFAQIIAFTGATQGLVELAVDAGLSRLGMLAIMMGILLIMGCLMDPLSILIVTVPIFVPLAVALHIDVMVLAVMMLINMEVAAISPPFGMSLFAMKAILPSDISMTTIWKSALPYIACIVVVILTVMFVPQVATWLPSLAGRK